MKITTTFLLLITSFIQAQNLNEIVAEIENKNIVEYVGNNNKIYSPFTSNDYIQLEKKATIEDLVNLTNHKNGAVKSLAFLVLCRKKYDKLYNIVLQSLKDTTTVKTRIGCVSSGSYTSDYFIMLVSNGSFEGYDLQKLTDSQKATINSLLITDKSSKLFARRQAIYNLESSSENYDLIKYLVKKERNTAALANLAKYKKQIDKKLIASFFKDEKSRLEALNSAIIFKDMYFYSFIVNAFEKEWESNKIHESHWEIQYKALANYPTEKTLSLLEKVTLEKNVSSYKYRILTKWLFVAIMKYPNPDYEILKGKIKIDEDDWEEVNLAINKI